MCLITLAWRAHPRYELVLAANRDEFHDRPSAPAAFWPDAPDVFGGRDLSQNGSWLALSRRGRMAAVTNVRRMVPPNPAAPSRGKLVANFVTGGTSAAAFAQQLAPQAAAYAGFNLLLFDGQDIFYVSNQAQFRCEQLEPGIHGLSNAALDTPWPKLCRLKDGMTAWARVGETQTAPLLQLLMDDRIASDAELPDTGVGLELERFLSPPFIRGERYGTRCSTVITLSAQGEVQFMERRFDAKGMIAGETRETISLRSR